MKNMCKRTMIMSICLLAMVLLTISIGLYNIHIGNLNGFILVLGGPACFFPAAISSVEFYLRVIRPYQKAEESLLKRYEKTIKSIHNEGIDVYIDGEPVSDNFAFKEIDLCDYIAKIEGNALYLIKNDANK